MLRIQRAAIGKLVVFILSGRIEQVHIPQLQALFDADGPGIAFDLKEVDIVDRDAVEFLARCEASGARLDNCLPYIREWIRRAAKGE